MSNFSGVQKNARPFKPQVRAGDGAGIGRTVAGVYEGQAAPVVFEKAGPVLDTDKAPDSGNRGERELGLSVDHPSADGQTVYLASKISRVYRRIVSDGADLENPSREERVALRDRLVSAVVDGGNQEPNDAASARSAINYVTEVASLLFGLIDELSETPAFLRAPVHPSPDSDRVGMIGADYLRLKAEPTGTLVKSLGTDVTVYCRILHKDASKREVHGVIAEEVPDKSGEIFDYASSEPHFRKWSSDALERTTAAGLPASFGNVRSQHRANAVGKLTSIEFDSANKRIPVVAKIVDDDTWRKIQAGVLTGFSIGGSYLNKWGDGSYVRYTAKPAEVSIVDNPCMPGATFSMVKDAPANPELAALKKQLLELKEKIQRILAARAGVNIDTTGSSGSRFVTKDAGSKDPRELMKVALQNGKPATFEGGHTKSGFKTVGTGEPAPAGAAKHFVDLPAEQQRKPFQPR